MNNTRKTRKARHKPVERLKREYQTSPVPEKVRVIFLRETSVYLNYNKIPIDPKKHLYFSGTILYNK